MRSYSGGELLLLPRAKLFAYTALACSVGRPTPRFLEQHLASGRLQFYDGDVTAPSSWEGLEAAHGADFTHVVSAAALTPTALEEQARPVRGLLNCSFVMAVLLQSLDT